MWIGTSGSGLNLCEPQENYDLLKYENYGTDEGLVNDVINPFSEIKTVTYGWLPSMVFRSLIRFTHSSDNYYFSSYTLGNVYSENSACNGKRRQVAFGTNYGMIVIDPEKIQNSDSFLRLFSLICM